jgi:hypothetical protein
VAKLAPDDASLAAARRLARPGPWSETGSNDTLLWGKCQGSGKTPYQVSIDLTGPAFRCSCPSRKFPCKHGLALMLLWVDGSGSVADVAEAAGFAREWADQRSERAKKPAATSKAPDPAAQAKRLEDRLALMTAGLDDFARWLGDLVRGGTAAARQQPYTWWDATAARLVDSQLPGLAEQVRAMGSEVSARPDWAEHLLASAGRWWTATRAWSLRESLEPSEMGDLRTFLGWPWSSEEIRQSDAVADRWVVLGAHRTDDGRLQQQRTWLWGEATGETVQVLDFAARGQTLAVARVVGSVLEASIARYPGTSTRRALFVSDPTVVAESGSLPAGGSLDDAAASAAAAWATNTWAWRTPTVLEGVRVAPGTPAYVMDAAGHSCSLTDDADGWMLAAVSGGEPVNVFGELEAGRLRALSVEVAGELVAL